MFIQNQERIFGSLSKRGIVGLSLASLCFIVIPGIFIPQLAGAQERQIAVKISKELPTVRSAALDIGIDVPWSQPVRIVDPFEGEYIGIFDKNYFYQRLLNTNVRVQVVSLWKPDSVRFLLAYSERDCQWERGFFSRGMSRNCISDNGALQLNNLLIKIGERIFRLEGQSSRFQVNRELATALKNAPTQNISIRLITESGETVDSQIGKGTVQGWKVIY